MSMLDVVQQDHDEYAAKGKELLTQMEFFDTYFSFKLLVLVFSTAEQLDLTCRPNSACTFCKH